MNYRYHLLRYAGPASRLTCPQCGRKHCFTPYVDSDDQIVGEQYGRCDHESSCGYVKYPPYEREWRQSWSEYQNSRKRPEKRVISRPAPKPEPPGGICTIPMDIVLKTVRTNPLSDFLYFLCKLFDVDTILQLIKDYLIGVTRSGDTIFYQIDQQGRCRSGKVMKYNRETGHRIKDETMPNRITWVHSLMKYAGQLPQEWTLTQCLFGEHLLPLFPEKPVALVESEKTAIICAGLIPKFIWLATGGKSQINARLDVLKGRSITAFPDIDGYSTWVEKLAQLEGFSYTVCDLLVKYGKPEDHEAHIDIADWLIRWHRTPNPRADATFAAVAQYFSPEVHEEIRALIHDLDLEFIGVEKIEKDEE